MAIREEAAEVAVASELVPRSVRQAREGARFAGSMTIDFWDYDGNVIPEIMFNPVGRITPNAIDRHLPHIYHQINIAQNKARHE
jgi:hypothetical protein